MTSKKIKIWGRDFELEVKYDCYAGESVLDIQKEAVELFNSDNITEESLKKIKEYCISKNSREIGNSIENIFKYVAPKYLFVPRSENKKIVAIMCNYRFDMENGIAIVFKNGQLFQIGSQDIIL